MPQLNFEQLFGPHITPLFKVAYQWTLNAEDAEDLVQELALKLVSRVDEMSSVDKLRPWLVKIMYRIFVDEFRRKQARPLAYEHLLEEDFLKSLTISDDSNPESDAMRMQLGLQLVSSLKQLDKEQAATLFLFEVEGYSLKEIAEIQDVSEGTVKSRLHRGRKIMKNHLEIGTFIDVPTCN